MLILLRNDIKYFFTLVVFFFFKVGLDIAPTAIQSAENYFDSLNNVEMFDITFQHGSFFDDVKENSYDVGYDVRSPFLLFFFSSFLLELLLERKRKERKKYYTFEKFHAAHILYLYFILTLPLPFLCHPPTHTHTVHFLLCFVT